MRLGERRVPLYSGAIHYFRHPRSSWRTQLLALRELGFELVETYIPWSVHERLDEDGQPMLDFGQYDTRCDLGGFLDLAQELGLLVFCRPGPHINAELTYFGLPSRIIHDSDCQARSPSGQPLPLIAPPQTFPVPSVASEAFFEATGHWLRAVGEVVAPRIWPRGPVVLLQVDNEAAYYFRDGPYDQDHHPDALHAYREFLRERHGQLEALDYDPQEAAPRRWDQVCPPARFEPPSAPPRGLLRHLEWAEFRGRLLLNAVHRHDAQMREAGLSGVPTVHNVPMGDLGLPYSLGDMDRAVAITGLDYYEGPNQLLAIKRRTLRLSGSVRVPYAPELGLGAPPWFVPRTGRQALQTALCALAYGVRGFNVYMAVNRDRWWGGLLHAGGEPTAQAEPCRQLLVALQRLRFHSLSMPVQVGLSVPAEYARLSQATHALGPLSPSLMALSTGNPTAACRDDRLGFQEAIQRVWWPTLVRFAEALERAGIPYVLVDSAAPLPPGLRLLVEPTYDFAAPERLRRAADFQAAGGRVLWGPQQPSLGADLSPLQAQPLAGEPDPALRDAEPTALDRRVSELQDLCALQVPARVEPPSVHASVHTDGDTPRVLFLMNPEPKAICARVSHPAPAELVDVLTMERFHTDAEGGIDIPPRSLRMLEVLPAPPRPDSAPPGAAR